MESYNVGFLILSFSLNVIPLVHPACYIYHYFLPFLLQVVFLVRVCCSSSIYLSIEEYLFLFLFFPIWAIMDKAIMSIPIESFL